MKTLATHIFLSFSVLKDAAYAQSLGSRLLMTVYKGIAPGEDRKALPSLDINTKRLADGLLQLAFSLSQQVSATGLWIRYSFPIYSSIYSVSLLPACCCLMLFLCRVSSWWTCC